MPRTATKDEQAELTDTLPVVSEIADVHHMIRTIGAQDMVEGAVGPATADAHVRTWLQQGYRLHTVLSLGNADVNGVFITRVLYILVRE